MGRKQQGFERKISIYFYIMELVANIILNNIDEFNQMIKDELVRKGINNTKNASNSLKSIQKDEKTFQSVGSDYIEILDQGRSPGKFAPVDSIQEWVKTKLGITDSREIRSIAYLVNRKIAIEGTTIYRNKSKGLELDVLIAEFTKKLIKDLTVFAIADVKKELNFFSSQKI